MNRRVAVIGLLVIAIVAIAVFVAPRLMGRTPAKPKPETIVLDIKGRYPATMTLAAVANWCPVTRVAEIEAVSVDTGFAIALHEIDSVTRGQHPVFALNPALPAPRPSATAALRWLRVADTTRTDTTDTRQRAPVERKRLLELSGRRPEPAPPPAPMSDPPAARIWAAPSRARKTCRAGNPKAG